LNFSDVIEKDRPLTSLALNTINKMALSNPRALFKRGVFKQLVILGQHQLELKDKQDEATKQEREGGNGGGEETANKEQEKNAETETKQENKEREAEGSGGEDGDEHRQKILLGVANVFLTFANDKDFRNALALGGIDASAEDNTTSALDIVLRFLNDPTFSLSLRGSAGMTLMKLCELCEKGEECLRVVREKVIQTNTIKTLVLLLLKSGDEEESEREKKGGGEDKGEKVGEKKAGFDESAFTNKAIVLDVLYALSNLDSFESDVESG